MTDFILCERWNGDRPVPLGVHPNLPWTTNDRRFLAAQADRIGATNEPGKIEMVICMLVPLSVKSHPDKPWRQVEASASPLAMLVESWQSLSERIDRRKGHGSPDAYAYNYCATQLRAMLENVT